MNDTEHDDGDDAGEPLGPSIAHPPLYVLRAADRCPACEEPLDVYALGCRAFQEADDPRPIEAFHFLREVRSVPPAVLAILAVHYPSFHFDHIDEDETPLLLNHCRCGARIDDDDLHGDVGAAFWPDTPDGYARLSVFRLPIEESVPVVSSFAIGGGEYLSFDKAVLW